MRHRVILAATVLWVVPLLAACASVTGPGASIGASAPAASPGGDEASLTPQRGGVVQTVGPRELLDLHPWLAVGANSVLYLTGGVYDGLVQYDVKPLGDYRQDFKLTGKLAESWEVKDSTTYVFRLRKNVKWHDGAPFTAADVKWSFDFMADPNNKVVRAVVLRTNLGSVTVLDDYTIQLTTKEADVAFLNGLVENAPILPKHLRDRGEDFARVAVGTGPFKVESWDRQQGITYVANKEYWRAGQPYLDKWRISGPLPDDATRIALFATGQNDVLKLLDKRLAESAIPLVKDARMAVFYRDTHGAIDMKQDRPPFNDKRVRRAVHLGIDRPGMIGIITAGEGLISPPGVNPVAKEWAIPQAELEQLPGWRTPKEPDLEEARRLLAAAGYGNGLTFNMSYDTGIPWAPSYTTVIAAQLRKIGITVNIQPMEQAVFQKARNAGDYQTIFGSGGGGSAPGDSFWRTNYRTGGPSNTMPVSDPELDRLIDAQGKEFDTSKRKALYLEIQRLLGREFYMIPTTADPGYLIFQPYLHGWIDNQAGNVGNLNWALVWLDQASAPKGR